MKQVMTLLGTIIITALLPACGYTTRVISPQPFPFASVTALPEAAQTLIIDDIQVIQNGKAGNVDPGFIQRFVLEMRRTGIFRAVYDPSNTPDLSKDAVHMKLVITETLDRHWGEKVGKDILVGLSYLTLMPVMPYQMDYTVSLRATITLPSEEAREIESSTKAEVDYKGLSDIRAAEEDLKRTATNDCLNGLLAKIKSDEGFSAALAVSEQRHNTRATLQEKPLEDRLRELKGLREKGLISSEEYYEKRAKLLEGF